MTNLLEQLKTMTVVVSDTGDINSIQKFRPRDATTNPSLIAAAAQMPAYAQLVDDALMWAKKDAPGEGVRSVAEFFTLKGDHAWMSHRVPASSWLSSRDSRIPSFSKIGSWSRSGPTR